MAIAFGGSRPAPVYQPPAGTKPLGSLQQPGMNTGGGAGNPIGPSPIPMMGGTAPTMTPTPVTGKSPMPQLTPAMNTGGGAGNPTNPAPAIGEDWEYLTIAPWQLAGPGRGNGSQEEQLAGNAGLAYNDYKRGGGRDKFLDWALGNYGNTWKFNAIRQHFVAAENARRQAAGLSSLDGVGQVSGANGNKLVGAAPGMPIPMV